VSDLHNAEFGTENKNLLSVIAESKPNIIVITGDIIDSRQTDVQVAVKFINNVSKIAPVYYVTGNHESRIGVENQIDNFSLDENVTILHNENVLLQKGESKIQLIGVDDPNFIDSDGSVDYMNSILAEYGNNEHFKILLSHRPELFETYVQNNMDIVFSGHAHGGQIRVPLVGGLFAPHQGLFPEYDSGIYTENNTNMIVSRGLGNSLFPFRVNNPPEIIIVTLDK
jgi:predicted MPP superfamily phosphohydrolase